MKSLCIVLTSLLLLSVVALAEEAPAADPLTRVPSSQDLPLPDAPQIGAKGHLLIDQDSGKVLAESNADERLEPASLTKVMTAYAVFRELARGNLSLSHQVLISEKAWRTGGSRMFVEVGKQVSVEDLLKGMIIVSGNDASVALAEHIAGSEQSFASLMNTHARRLGMTNTHYMNATGLPHPDHYTSARDLTLITAATIREFPEYYAWYSQKEFAYNGIKQKNRNRLLWRDGAVDGVKTGHTESAGYSLVASAKRGDMRLTSVVMGSKGEEARAQASLALLNYGFRFYESHRLYPRGEPVESLRVWMGDISNLPVGPVQDVVVTIPRRKYDQLSAHLVKEPDISAPVAKGATVGYISVALKDEEIQRVPLVALRDVAEGGVLQRAWDMVLRWF